MAPFIEKVPLEVLSKIEQVISRLDRIEKKIDECCSPACMDFSLESTGKFFPLIRNIGNHSLDFSTSDPFGIVISGYATVPSRYGLYFHTDLKIVITPPCKKITFELSSFANLDWIAYDSAGQPLQSIPSSPAPHNIPSFTFTVTGDIQVIKFRSSNESNIKKICCYDN
jgi:hypothetical protein